MPELEFEIPFCGRAWARVTKTVSPLADQVQHVAVVAADVIVAQGMATAGTLDVTMESLTNGGHRWHGDEHRWHCTTWAVEALLRATGWSDVTRVGINSVPDFWPVADRRPQWQCAVSARP